MNAGIAAQARRAPAIDALRGLVMILMALDHARDFLHADAMVFSPEDLTKTTTALFLTRWITHFCAPVFMLTAGMGAYLWGRKGRTKRELSTYLVTRGAWLMLLEVTVLRFALTFSLTSGTVILTVFWGLGLSMAALALIVHLPMRVIAAGSVAVMVLHNLMDPVTASQFGSWGWLWNIVHQPGAFVVGGVPVIPAYSLVPWAAVMAAGYCLGTIMTWEPHRRHWWLLRVGLIVTAAFLVLRAMNGYGDPIPWSNENPGMTLVSFLRCNKYPPSLDFLLMTLGPGLLVLSWFDRRDWGRMNPLIVFGRVPFFYFLAHMFLLHLLAFPLALVRYGRADFVWNLLPSMGGDPKLYPPGYGYELGVIYLIWAGVVIALYPLCAWFSRVKERRRDWWLGYL